MKTATIPASGGVQSEWAWVFSTLRLPSKEKADAFADRCVKRAAEELMAMKDQCMCLSGDDSPLRSTWDEICVLCQSSGLDSDSAYWQAIGAIFHGMIEALAPMDYLKLQVATKEGWCWLYVESRERQMSDREDSEPTDEEIVEMLSERLVRCAENHTNQRIRRYLDRRGLF